MPETTNRRRRAVLSCDLDPIDCHLMGYGVGDAPPCDVIYRRAVPRLLDLLDECGVPAVFFFVARDAAREGPLLRQILNRGHEVASHSFTHPERFRALDDSALARETIGSRAALTDATGISILGFRAPAWDIDERVLNAVAAAGYAYDTSIFPSPALLLQRLRCKGNRHEARATLRVLAQCWAPLRPHLIGSNGNSLVEFPIGVTRFLRVPAYHTVSHIVPWFAFERILRAALRGRSLFSYEFHAADVLDLEGDGVDPRMIVHPGMRLPLERKLETLRMVLSTIAAERTVVTYSKVVDA